MKKYIIIIILVLITLPCFAVNWVECGYKTYIDLSSWRRNGNYVSAWIKLLNNGNWDLIDNKKVWYKIEYIETDCNASRISVNSKISYDMQGNLINSLHYKVSDFIPVVPDSIGEEIYYTMCRLK